MELRKTTDQQARAKALDSKHVGLGAARTQNESQVQSGGLNEAKPLHRPAHADRIELSEAARNHMASNQEGEALRANLVNELRTAYQDGSLLSQERIENAAARLLGA
ncbi:MAG: hypothetical protein P1V35_14670 [Planctomycetota bacterium]|nr:hypothetical protein [Planctomycetota bacterium]